ncbi:hypothetical protein ACFOLA_02610 [Salinicoccus hispanicus]|uniref:Uncharacterized protein n=1 Tax=Salinicoccus hispanicus TaxID=157225 RepID=A0A6N8U0M2_9STAP|nr:hypothetical protein [Salinicoccus hispanicus]MXQ50476.1 hypothetical protein [Salinicoccus hispanicus]
MDNETGEAKARREAAKQTGVEGSYEKKKRSGLTGCLIIAISLVVLMVILGSCTGVFYGDEQDENITEDQGSTMDDNGTGLLQLASERNSYSYLTLEMPEATFKVASFRSIGF